MVPGQPPYLVGASKNSVPLMMTKWAGVFTPQARVEVATSTCRATRLSVLITCG